jgi:hypothetical protein
MNIVLEKDNAQNRRDVGLPFVIVEVKKGQPNVHDILAYSQKAEMIKTISPFCRFALLVKGKIAARTHRHGINFDSIIQVNNLADHAEVRALRHAVKKLLSQAEQRCACVYGPGT